MIPNFFKLFLFIALINLVLSCERSEPFTPPDENSNELHYLSSTLPGTWRLELVTEIEQKDSLNTITIDTVVTISDKNRPYEWTFFSDSVRTTKYIIRENGFIDSLDTLDTYKVIMVPPIGLNLINERKISGYTYKLNNNKELILSYGYSYSYGEVSVKIYIHLKFLKI